MICKLFLQIKKFTDRNLATKFRDVTKSSKKRFVDMTSIRKFNTIQWKKLPLNNCNIYVKRKSNNVQVCICIPTRTLALIFVWQCKTPTVIWHIFSTYLNTIESTSTNMSKPNSNKKLHTWTLSLLKRTKNFKLYSTQNISKTE